MAMSIKNALIPFKDWNKLSGSQQVTILLSIGGGLTSVVTLLLTGTSRGFYSSLIASVTLPTVIDKLNRYVFENNTTKELARHMDSKLDLKFIGKTSAAIDYMCSCIAGATSVENTALRQKQGPGPYLETTEYTQKAVRAMSECLTQGCQWHDLYFSLGSDSHNEVVADRFFNSLSPQQRENYSHSLLPASFPFFQMIIINYADDDRPSTLLFGWDYAGGIDSLVFQSSESRVVDYFRLYYKSLDDKATRRQSFRADIPVALNHPAP